MIIFINNRHTRDYSKLIPDSFLEMDNAGKHIVMTN